MKNLYLLLGALLVASCSGTPKPESESDKNIMGLKGNIESITQQAYKIELSESGEESRVSNPGDRNFNLSMGSASIAALHNLDDVVKRQNMYEELGEDYSYRNAMADCNFNIKFNKAGDATTYTFKRDDTESYRTDCQYSSNGYVKDKRTYTIGERYAKYGKKGFLNIHTKYNNHGLPTSEISYGGYINENHQVDSMYEYDRVVMAYDKSNRMVSKEVYDEGIRSERETRTYKGENRVTVKTEKFEDGKLVIPDPSGPVVYSGYNGEYEIDEYGELTEIEDESTFDDETSSEMVEMTVPTNQQRKPYKFTKIKEGYKRFYIDDDKWYSEYVEHTTKDVFKYDDQGNWIEKRKDYIYADGTIEHSDYVFVREIQYFN